MEFNRKPHRGPQVCRRRKQYVCACVERKGLAYRRCCGSWCLACKGHVGPQTRKQEAA